MTVASLTVFGLGWKKVGKSCKGGEHRAPSDSARSARSAANIVMETRAASIELRIEGDDVMLTAAGPPPPAVLELLALHKAQVIALLRPGRDGWSGKDWRAFFEERAGIAEFDGGLIRDQAEARAFACCVADWLNRNPVRAPPGRCLECGEREHSQEPLLPFGIETTGHAWLHSRCWAAWHESRNAEAVAYLRSKIFNGPVNP